MGGARVCAGVGGCLVARPKSGPPPAYPVRATGELPRVTVVLTGLPSYPPGAGRSLTTRKSVIFLRVGAEPKRVVGREKTPELLGSALCLSR